MSGCERHGGHYRRVDRVPPTGLVLAAVGSVQFGAALAKTLFDDLGPGGTVFLRVAFAAALLLALWRPRLKGRSARDWRWRPRSASRSPG